MAISIAAADAGEPDVRTFCGVLAFAGCRLSEALELTADRIDLAGGTLVVETLKLKKRWRGVFRAVPVPPALLDAMNLVHGIRKLQARRDGVRESYLAKNTQRSKTVKVWSCALPERKKCSNRAPTFYKSGILSKVPVAKVVK